MLFSRTKEAPNGQADAPVLATRDPSTKDIDIQWFNRMVHQSAMVGVQTEMHRLTPALAEYLLGDDRNPMNRNISDRQVASFAQDINDGRWRFNGEPLIISRDGFLNDGQHRCSAVVATETSIEFLWVFGVTRDSRTTLDQGRVRSASDFLKMDGMPYATNSAAVAAIVMEALETGAAHYGRKRPTKGAVVEYVHKHPDIIESCASIPTNTRTIGGHSALAAAHYLISKVGEPEDVEDFFHKLVTGENLTARNPILVCRKRLTEMVFNRERVNYRLECIIRGWNNYRSERRVSRLLITGGQLPKIAA